MTQEKGEMEDAKSNSMVLRRQAADRQQDNFVGGDEIFGERTMRFLANGWRTRYTAEANRD